MANGQTVGAHSTTRRNTLPRVSSTEGTDKRAARRAASTPKVSNKYSAGYRTPGSRNPRKVGRG